jgi:hypothetical protein
MESARWGAKASSIKKCVFIVKDTPLLDGIDDAA